MLSIVGFMPSLVNACKLFWNGLPTDDGLRKSTVQLLTLEHLYKPPVPSDALFVGKLRIIPELQPFSVTTHNIDKFTEIIMPCEWPYKHGEPHGRLKILKTFAPLGISVT